VRAEFFRFAGMQQAERFSACRRLRTSAEFARVFADAQRSSDRYFTVLARASEQRVPRLGLTISRRAARLATQRNTLKRLARESFRSAALPAWDFVVLAKPGAAAADKAVLRRSLDLHFARLSGRGR
jgi:ribonuclease P protein component